MSLAADKVRFRNDGDQFHYLWAARRCLRLLVPTSDLVAVSIEGVCEQIEEIDSDDDSTPTPNSNGVEVIDVAEYYGDEDPRIAASIEYIQLKHSTKRTDQNWTPSELERTVAGFSSYYKKLGEEYGLDCVRSKIRFKFVSNRRIGSDLLETLVDVENGSQPRHPALLEKLKCFSGFDDAEFVHFAKCLSFIGNEEHYQLQRSTLALETRAYLPGNDLNAPLRLKELVTRKACSENINEPAIRKEDVLREFGVIQEDLYPVVLMIDAAHNTMRRVQEDTIVSSISTKDGPFIVHAAGGVGKTVLARRIADRVVDGGICVLYDCFGNGQYRHRSRPRHRHQDAFVQIANELAGAGLCDPLIPVGSDAAAYARAFVHRLAQASDTLASRNSESQLWLIIDAADNAQMAADEFNDGRSFVQDLIRESLPARTKLVMLCRTERRNLLNLPGSAQQIELRSFELAETSGVVRQNYHDASDDDIHEFHRLSSANPRVQAYALAQTDSLSSALRALGPKPTTIDDAIKQQLEAALSRSMDKAGQDFAQQINSLCTALAVLRPLVPIDVLSKISGADVSAIKSFATDFGALRIDGNALQFRDEPVESWFRDKFRATQEQLQAFLLVLKPMANENVYVSACLPFLLLEAGWLDELVLLALESKGLPSNSPVDRREIELQRLQFALKASLRSKRYVEAGKLAFKAGCEMAGNSRQQRLLQDNTDLVAVLLDKENVYDIAYSRKFVGNWLGAQFAYEAALLSFFPEFKGDARSKLRISYDWLKNYFSRPKDSYSRERLGDADIAEMAMTSLNVGGVNACARALRNWVDRRVSLRVGAILARRLVDQGRFDDLMNLSTSAENDLGLLLAIACELRAVHRLLPEASVRRAVKLLRRKNVINIVRTRGTNDGASGLLGIIAILDAAERYRVADAEELSLVLEEALPPEPPRDLNSYDRTRRYALLSAYCFLAHLKGEDITIPSLAYPELRQTLVENKTYQDRREVSEFKATIGGLLPWHKLRAEVAVDAPSFMDSIEKALKETVSATFQVDKRRLGIIDDVARIWFEILLRQFETPPKQLLDQFKSWIDKREQPFFTTTWTALARSALRSNAGTDVVALGYEFCRNAFELMHTAKEDSESKASTYIDCARALLVIDRAESVHYFNSAITVVSAFGDEVYQRLEALNDLAERLVSSEKPSSELALRFARCVEIAEGFVYDHFDYEGTAAAICNIDSVTGLAVISRWRDQRFGIFEEFLPATIQHLLAQEKISPLVAASLTPLCGRWNYGELLEKSLNSVSAAGEKQEILDQFIYYLSKEWCSDSTWEQVRNVGAFHNLSIARTPPLTSPDLQVPTRPDLGPTSKIVWDEIFDGLPVDTIAGISTAYRKFRSSPPPLYDEQFWREVFARIQIQHRAGLITTVCDAPEFGLSTLRDFLQEIPEVWTSIHSIQHAIKSGITSICKRFCLEFDNNRRYQRFPLPVLNSLAGSELDTIGTILASIANISDPLDSDRLFKIVGLIALKLGGHQASEVLEFALTEFELEAAKLEGYEHSLFDFDQSIGMTKAIALLLWSGLAAPEASVRWRFAHTVRLFFSLGVSDVIDALVSIIESRSGHGFADSKFEFYHLNAQLYLLIALSWCAVERPTQLIKHLNVFVDLALIVSHVLIRHFAAQTALAIAAASEAGLDEDVLRQLREGNYTHLVAGHEEDAELSMPELQDDADDDCREDDEVKFHFNMDIESYWFGNLARCFGLGGGEIKKRAAKIITEQWTPLYDGRWAVDARHKQYRDSETYHSHGGYPKTEDLDFYLSYHAMMILAGDLLRTKPALADRYDEGTNQFESWLNSQLLTRSDGRWIADRVDPIFSDVRLRAKTDTDSNWRWSVSLSDFSEAVGSTSSRKVLWEHSKRFDGEREETVDIRSALVSPEKSEALLAALQTHDNYYHYKLPSANDDRFEIDEHGFVLKGWLHGSTGPTGLDKFDPWAGRINYPCLRPSEEVCTKMELRADRELRTWTSGVTMDECLWSLIWGNWNGNRQEVDHGERLYASDSFVEQLLKAFEMDLIIEVTIDRDYRRNSNYGAKKDDEEIESVQPCCKLFVLRRNGGIFSYSQSFRTRAEASSGAGPG